ncbi:TPA: site-specific integrase [Streptococcus agalactiae]
MIKICKEKSQHQSYAALYLIAKTGMRFAECLGLTVNDIDYTNKYLSINKTWDYHFNQRYLPTKNKSSIRNIPIDNDTLFFLHEFTKNKNDRLFDKLSNNAVNKTIRKITGREVRVHSLRHTFASYLISISQVLDHENLNITLEVYAHQLQEQKDRNDKLNQRNLGRIWGKIALNRYLHAMNMSPSRNLLLLYTIVHNSPSVDLMVVYNSKKFNVVSFLIYFAPFLHPFTSILS